MYTSIFKFQILYIILFNLNYNLTLFYKTKPLNQVMSTEIDQPIVQEQPIVVQNDDQGIPDENENHS